eukprot:gb/GFBE01069662.1/.p1 GENE.gb/GFBE01069662.1/~~gb/GFBE01069662.1/.p1  ORF type:complete len:244 (+),score=42.61 gb/GFBE01069662.1/:1-732(+)
MRRSPLIVAARCGLVSIAWLIARHCDPNGLCLNQQDAMGCSALRYAIVNKDERMCGCLLGFPALHLEQRDARGDTSLMQAVGANAPSVCRRLLERSADASYVNRGQTALDLAEALGYQACIDVLRSFGAPSAPRSDQGLAADSLGALAEGAEDVMAGDNSPESDLDEEVRESERAWLCRRKAQDVSWTGPDLDLDALDDDDEVEQARSHGSREAKTPAKRPQRWDVGGLFIKRRGGQSMRWHG